MPASPWGHSAKCQLPSVFRSGRAFEAPQGLPSSSPHSPHVTPDSHLQAPPQPFPRHWLESLCGCLFPWQAVPALSARLPHFWFTSGLRPCSAHLCECPVSDVPANGSEQFWILFKRKGTGRNSKPINRRMEEGSRKCDIEQDSEIEVSTF